MSSNPDLIFRRLDDTEKELAAALAASNYGPEAPESISFGLTAAGPPAAGGELWGVFIRGALAAALWVLPLRGAVVEVAAAVIPPGRRRMGLLEWMLGEVARAAALAGGRELLIRLDGGGPALGEALTDAEFIGPDSEAEGYPKGEWRRFAS